MRSFERSQWALILGGSSGFGLATADKLSRHGMSVFVVHRDRRGSMSRIQPAFDAIATRGVGFRAVNIDALSESGRGDVLGLLREALGDAGRVRLLMHSIAFGNLKRALPPPDASTTATEPLLQDEDWARTVHAMGTSLATWTQSLLEHRYFADDARVIALTSEGNRIAWPGYAAVSAAKAALESVARAIAKEGAPHGLRCNIVQAGVTDTPALRLIPGHEQMLAMGQMRNPFGRTTRPEDVAAAICLLCTDEAAWINGSLICVDGGEHLG